MTFYRKTYELTTEENLNSYWDDLQFIALGSNMGFKTGNLNTVEPYCKAAGNTNLDITVPDLFGYKTGELASKIVPKSIHVRSFDSVSGGFYQTILMRVKIYLKVQTQFHCPLYHIYSRYSDTASILDQDQTAPKDCCRSALYASAFIKHSLIPQ